MRPQDFVAQELVHIYIYSADHIPDDIV
jgi:hypothetical protein